MSFGSSPSSEIPRLLSANDLADRLGEPVHVIYRLSRLGRIPTVHLGRLVRYDPRAVDGWLREGGAALDARDGA